jgi:hypothetical protein
MARHACDGIIQDNYGGVGFIISNINQACDAGMDKGGIADHRYCPACILFIPRLHKAVKPGNRRPHTYGGVYGPKRRNGSQSIAPYIAQNRKL